LTQESETKKEIIVISASEPTTKKNEATRQEFARSRKLRLSSSRTVGDIADKVVFKPSLLKQFQRRRASNEFRSHNFFSDPAQKIKQTVTNKGILLTASLALQRSHNHGLYGVTVRYPCWYYRTFKKNRTFLFENQELKYFYSEYNVTWKNERAVEIPIVCHLLKTRTGKLLEVGNVLSHYFDNNHDVVDKFEKGDGVLNEDITEVRLAKNYDTIVSISTLEHIGWDENAKGKRLNDQEKIPRAIDAMKNFLLPGGTIIITVPIGFNPHLDKLIGKRKLNFYKESFLHRISRDTWIETDWESVKDCKFDRPYPAANAILVGMIKN
jgi:hypothetical protein